MSKRKRIDRYVLGLLQAVAAQVVVMIVRHWLG